MNIMPGRISIAVLVCFIFAAAALCQITPLPSAAPSPPVSPLTGSQETRQPIVSSLIPTPTPDPEKVVLCLVDDRRLTRAMADRMIDKLMRSKKGTPEYLERMRYVYTQNIMQDWLDMNLLAVEAETEGIKVAEEEITAQEEELKKASKVTFEVDNALAKLGLSKEEYRAQLRDAILGDKLIRRRFSSYYSEKDLEEIYKNSPSAFQRSPRVRADHIFCPLRGTESIAEKTIRTEFLEQAKKELKNGKDPLDIIKNADPSFGLIGGELGWQYPANRLPNPVNSLLFELKVKSVSNVIETDLGYYLLRIEEKQPLHGRTYQEARDAVIDTVLDEVRKKVLDVALRSHKVMINISGIPENKM
jgi:parvulin-like peptidyl-prolyl isomerase